MTDGLQSGVADAVKVGAGIWLFLWMDGLTEGLDAKNRYLPVLLGVLQTVGSAIVVALISALLTGWFNRLRLTFEWRTAEAAPASSGRPSLPPRGQVLNLQLLVEGESARARWVRRNAADGHMNIHFRFWPEDALLLRIEDQTPRKFNVRGDRVTIRGLKLDPGRNCHADISLARQDRSTHPMEVNFAVSIEWTRGNRMVRAILNRSVRIVAGVTGFDMRGV